MAVYVRDLRPDEGNALLRLARGSKSPIEVRRAQVLIASDQGMKASAIGELYHLSTDYVRKIIHAFNRDGMESVKVRYTNGGRPSRFSAEERSMVVEVATMPPRVLGRPFTHWSLRKLRDYLVQTRTVPDIAHEQVRQILSQAGFSLQRTKTWKESKDPDFEVKKKGSRGSTRTRRRTDE